MPCSRCGRRCQGRMCAECERQQHQENTIGTPREIMGREEETEEE